MKTGSRRVREKGPQEEALCQTEGPERPAELHPQRIITNIWLCLIVFTARCRRTTLMTQAESEFSPCGLLPLHLAL